jgi:excinuclease ABC subunit C
VRDQLYAIGGPGAAEIPHRAVDGTCSASAGDRLLFYALYVRRGRITGGQAFPLSGREFHQGFCCFVSLYYDNDNLVPKRCSAAGPEEAALEALADLLTETATGSR